MKVASNKLMVKMMSASLLVVLPLVFSCLFLYSDGSSLMRKQVMERMAVEQENVCAYIDDEINRLCGILTDSTIYDDLCYLEQLYSILSVYQRARRINDLMDWLSLWQRNIDLISEIRIHIPRLNWTLTSDEKFWKMTEEYDFLMQIGSKDYLSFELIEDEITVVTRFPWLSDEKRYIVVAQLDFEAALKNVIPQEAGWNTYVFHRDSGRCFVSQNNALFEAYMQVRDQIGNETSVCIDGDMYCLREQEWGGVLSVLTLIKEESLFEELKEYRDLFLFAMVYSSILICLYAWTFSRIINRPVKKLIAAFEQVKQNRFDITLDYRGNDEFAVLYRNFEHMMADLSRLINDNYKQHILMQRMELRQLHAQVNPHFLENMFLNIFSMAQMDDSEGIQEMCLMMSKYYQYFSAFGQSDVTLAQEYRFIEVYASIQTIRFGGRLEIEIGTLPEQIANLKFPKFALQTLVENAYKYGAGKRETQGVIRVAFEIRGSWVVICVEDNGQNADMALIEKLRGILKEGKYQEGTGMGLISVSERLRLFYEGKGRLDLDISALGGMQCVIWIEIDAEAKKC